MNQDMKCKNTEIWDLQKQRVQDLAAFASYTNQYDAADPQIALKILHTQKVVEIMDRLCQAEQVPARQAYLHFLAALYHDIGRFEQVRRYHTFLDAVSIDHAQLSADILRKGEFLSHLSEEEKLTVLAAIENHNKLKINSEVTGNTLYMAKMIRDADKLDIFRVFAEEDLQASCNGSLEQALQETVSDPVYAAVMEGRCVRKEDRKTSLDIWCTFLGFFADLNFDISFQIAQEQGYYLQPFQQAAFENPQTRMRVQAMLMKVENEISQRVRSI